MFNRWTAGKQAALRVEKARRPYLASECKDLNSADKWRQDILREIGKKVMDIQNAGLGEHRIRDLNDKINKLIREKHHWEKRILQLGGPNYISQGRRIADEEKGEVVGRPGGYQYFGAAKNLPGVKELFEKPKPRSGAVWYGALLLVQVLSHRGCLLTTACLGHLVLVYKITGRSSQVSKPSDMLMMVSGQHSSPLFFTVHPKKGIRTC